MHAFPFPLARPALLPAVTLIASLLMACGGPAREGNPVENLEATETSGGETPVDPAGTVRVLRTTIPVPVPQPAVPREELSEPLQTLWTRTEEVVAQRPPEAPTEASPEAIRDWAESELAPWVDSRRRALEAAEPLIADVGNDAALVAMAAALFGYVYEDTAAGIRGAPVPSELAQDQELLAIYVESLDQLLRPFALRAVESYAFCAVSFSRLGESSSGESPWMEWGVYCLTRGHEVAEVYELSAPQPDEDADPPASGL